MRTATDCALRCALGAIAHCNCERGRSAPRDRLRTALRIASDWTMQLRASVQWARDLLRTALRIGSDYTLQLRASVQCAPRPTAHCAAHCERMHFSALLSHSSTAAQPISQKKVAEGVMYRIHTATCLQFLCLKRHHLRGE